MLSMLACEPVVRELVAAEVVHQRRINAHEAQRQLMAVEALGEPPLALDSLELLGAAQAVNIFFRLHEVGTEDYLLRYRSISQWCEVVRSALEHGTSGLTFLSGGSTGRPRSRARSWEALQAEVASLASIVEGRRRVVCDAPLQHIYGFTWGAWLAEHLDVPLLYGPLAGDAIHRGLRAGDLVVSVPERWRYLATVLGRLPADVIGVTSTARCPPSVARDLADAGLGGLVEVYGSSETGGVGWRVDPLAPYCLFDHWHRGDGDALIDKQGNSITAPDNLRWHDDRHLEPGPRRDDVVQVGGTNVKLTWVRDALLEHPQIADCAVRPTDTRSGLRLKAFVVEMHVGEPISEQALRDWIRARFATPERPVQLDFGNALPRNEIGKLCDW